MINAHRMLRCLSIAVAMMLLPVNVEGQDTITLQKAAGRGTRVSGRITDTSPTEITVESSGSKRTVSVNEIVRIALDGEPSGLKQARAALAAGQYEQALEALDKVQLPKSAADLLQQELDFARGQAAAQLALKGSGDVAEASKLLVDFVRKNRNTFHFYECAELLGQLAVASGNYENATRYFQHLSNAPWSDFKLRSDVLVGNSLRAQGKFDDAIRQFDSALDAKAKEPAELRQVTFAQLGKAACLAEQGQYDKAIESIENVIANNDPDDAELFAQAYLALGSAQRTAKRPIDAVLAYLHIDLLFYSQRDAHAEALFYLSQLWPQLEEPARGVEARQLLIARYAGSVWAQRAK